MTGRGFGCKLSVACSREQSNGDITRSVSLLIWFLLNVLLAISVNVYFWRRTSGFFRTGQSRTTLGLMLARISLHLIVNSWALGVFFHKMARHLGQVAGIDSAAGFLSAARNESSLFISLLLLSYGSQFLVVPSILLGVAGFVLAQRKQDRVTRIFATVAVCLNIAIISFWLMSLSES